MKEEEEEEREKVEKFSIGKSIINEGNRKRVKDRIDIKTKESC